MNDSCRLAVDIGNSGAKVVPLPVGAQSPLPLPIRISWPHKSVPSPSAEFWEKSLQQIWGEHLTNVKSDDDSSEWWISSVNRPACNSLMEFLGRRPKCRIELIDYRRIPLEIHVDFPDRVGIDRLLAAFAASRFSLERPLLVIQAGTAVTVDLLDKCPSKSKDIRWTDQFEGGAIVPGVPMMLQLLNTAADLLPKVVPAELVELPPLPGRNSQAAMLAGTASSLVGGVQHLVLRYRQNFGTHIPIVLSGGDGPLLAPHLTQPIIEVDHLVLEGLRLLAREVEAPAET